MWWISILLMVLGGIFNAGMDVLKTRYKTSIFKNWKYQNWIDPSIAWHNKWNVDIKLLGRESFIIDKFMSTMFVCFTDLWHFFKTLMLFCIATSIVLYQPIINPFIDVIILYSSFTVTFEIFYTLILVEKK